MVIAISKCFQPSRKVGGGMWQEHTFRICEIGRVTYSHDPLGDRALVLHVNFQSLTDHFHIIGMSITCDICPIEYCTTALYCPIMGMSSCVHLISIIAYSSIDILHDLCVHYTIVWIDMIIYSYPQYYGRIDDGLAPLKYIGRKSGRGTYQPLSATYPINLPRPAIRSKIPYQSDKTSNIHHQSDRILQIPKQSNILSIMPCRITSD
jgi:hypothetical protein